MDKPSNDDSALPEIADAAIALKGTFGCTAAPVDADGTVSGYEWYFRARGRDWEFTVSLDPKIPPDTIYNSEQGFYRTERYGSDEFDASYLPLAEAVAIIRRCAREFVASLPK